jgi:hypothetical protein
MSSAPVPIRKLHLPERWSQVVYAAYRVNDLEMLAIGVLVDSTPDGIIIELYSDQNGPVEPFLCSIGWSNIVQLTLNGLAECWGAEDPGAGG